MEQPAWLWRWQCRSPACPVLQLLLVMVLTVVGGAQAAGAGSGAELNALTAIRRAILQDPLGIMRSWRSDGNNSSSGAPCSWRGIRCDNSSSVVELDLSDALLTGSISPAIGDLSKLTVLNMSSNQLSGPIPDSITKLTRLQSVDLSFNRDDDDAEGEGAQHETTTGLSGPIPAGISRLSSLRYLLLNSNRLNGSVPAELAQLRNLEWLYLDTNELTGILPPGLGSLGPQLTDLDVSSNGLDGSIPRQLGNLTGLQWLGLHLNGFTGAIPEELGGCSQLLFLDLQGNQLEGGIPASLGKLALLENLYLQDNPRLAGIVPAQLGNCTSLLELFAYSNGLEGGIPPTLGDGLTSLRMLQLHNNSLTGGIPASIASIPSLAILTLSSNRLTGPVPAGLGNLSNLQVLSLFDNRLTGGLPARFQSRALTLLDAHDNPTLGGRIPTGLCQQGGGGGGGALTILALSNSGISGSIPRELASCVSLRRLRLGNNSLSGGIPDFCSTTSNGPSALSFVELSSNALTGAVPASLGKCVSLTALTLDDNQLQGGIPPELASAPNLTVLNMSGNQLQGPVPGQLGGLSRLLTLALSSNSLSGGIPAEISNLSSLQVLHLGDNRLDGTVPPSLGSLGKLQNLQVGGNRLSGSIPVELGSLRQLIYGLNLSHNELVGSIPASLGKLEMLEVLDLSHNKLSGSIPEALGNLASLSTFNVSYNQLAGPVPVTPTFSKFPQSSFVGNPGLCGSVPGLLPACQLGSSNKKSKQRAQVGSGAAVGIAVAAVVVCLLGLYAAWKLCGCAAGKVKGDSRGGGEGSDDAHTTLCCARWCAALGMGTRSKRKSRAKDSKAAVSGMLPDLYLHYSYADIMSATSNLSDKNLIGQGGFGKVYKGVLASGQLIAVKKLSVDASQDPDAFQSHVREMETAGNIRHRNIVRLIGFCGHRDTSLILYDYLPFGSLGDVLHKKKEGAPSLDWESRYQIALGTAHAIAYLHSECAEGQIIHRDIKANNILLDEDLVPHVTDFGVAKLVAPVKGDDKPPPMSVVAGSAGYIAPEYAYTMHVGEKSDVYSFGVVLLELLTGKMPTDDPSFGEDGGTDLVHWVRHTLETSKTVDVVLDQALSKVMHRDPEAQEIAATLRVANMCTSAAPSDRPTMKEVVDMLVRAKDAHHNTTR